MFVINILNKFDMNIHYFKNLNSMNMSSFHSKIIESCQKHNLIGNTTELYMMFIKR